MKQTNFIHVLFIQKSINLFLFLKFYWPEAVEA